MKNIILYGLVSLILMGCGDGSGGSGDIGTPAPAPDPGPPPPLQTIPITPPATASNRVSFSVPEDTVSFALYLEGSSVNFNDVRFASVEDPSGSNVLIDINQSLQDCDLGFCSVLLPKQPGITIIPGTWSFSLTAPGGNTQLLGLDITLVTRVGELASNNNFRFTVQPYIASAGDFSESSYAMALNLMEGIFSAVGGQATVNPAITVSSQFATVSSDFNNATTQQLINQGSTDTVNVFFIDQFSDGTNLGIAGGIPGALTSQSPYNGVMVAGDPHVINASLNNDLLSSTIAHEIGHLLGLFHTTEANGLIFDILSDTPECPASIFDVNNDNSIDVDECSTRDASNLMFPTGQVGFSQTTISNAQAFVLRSSPISEEVP